MIKYHDPPFLSDAVSDHKHEMNDYRSRNLN